MFGRKKKSDTMLNKVDAIEFEIVCSMFSMHTKLSFFKHGNTIVALHRSSEKTVWHEIIEYHWDNFIAELFDDVKIHLRNEKWFEYDEELVLDDTSYYLYITYTNGVKQKFSGGTCCRGVDIFRQLVAKHFKISVYDPKEKNKEEERDFIPDVWKDIDRWSGVKKDWSFLDSEPQTLTFSARTSSGQSWCIMDLQADETFWKTKRIRREIYILGEGHHCYINGNCIHILRQHIYKEKTKVYQGAVALDDVWEFLDYILHKFDFRMLNPEAFRKHQCTKVRSDEEDLKVSVEINYNDGHKDYFEMESGSVAENFLKCCLEKSTILWMINP